MSVQSFCTLPDGRQVQVVNIAQGALSACILTLGGIVQDLRLQGAEYPLVLGSPDGADYLGCLRYVGANVGRFANRIAKGRFCVDGRHFETDRNFLGRHTLHGGRDGADQHIWHITSWRADHVSLSLHLPDGHMGFPGNFDVQADYTVTADALIINFSARADAPTPCSFAHHGYFDLDGRGDIRNHSLTIDAEHYLPIDDECIPTGEIAPVSGTAFDFRETRRIGASGYDHNFCLSDRQLPVRPVACLTGESGLAMQIETTACGLQLYDGAGLSVAQGHDGRNYGPWSGIALETQAWPDAVNQPGFPCAILRPGQGYSETTIYRFIT